jgi:S1-C subfamily serine protease
LVVAILAIAGVFSSDDSSDGKTVTTAATSDASLVKQTKPGVVELFGKAGRGTPSGSGFVIDAKQGLALTNAHVISGLATLKAVTLDEETVPAAVVGQSPCDDIALVRMRSTPAGVRALPLGDSSTVQNGDRVASFGYPLAAGRASAQKVVTTFGAVSSPDVRNASVPVRSLPRYAHVIQHQALIAPGNSGGPLVNSAGRVVGINALGIQSLSQSYAIAINEAKNVLPDLKAGKNPNYVGWRLEAASEHAYEDELPPVIARALRGFLARIGATNALVVTGVDTGSPAYKKVFPGDVLLQVEGTGVRSVRRVCDVLESKNPGDAIQVSGGTFDLNRNKYVTWTETLRVQ